MPWSRRRPNSSDCPSCVGVCLEDPNPGRSGLGQTFCELPELEKARIRILREVPLGQHPEPQQLLVMFAQGSKIAGKTRGGWHERWIEGATGMAQLGSLG